MSVFGTWLKEALIGSEIIDVVMDDIDIKYIKIRITDGSIRRLSATSKEFIWVSEWDQ